MDIQIERIKAKGIKLKDLLKDKFVTDMEAAGFDLDYVHLACFSITKEKDKDGKEKEKADQISFFHSSRDDVKEGFLHVESEGNGHIEKLKTVLEKFCKKETVDKK